MRVFITHVLPKDKALKYKISAAACNFSWNLIEGSVFDKYFSILPPSVHSDMDDLGMPGLVYSNLRTKGSFFCKLAIIYENWLLFQSLPKDCSVWLYNITSLNQLLFVLLKFFRKRVKLNIIILDHNPTKDWRMRLLLWAYNHCDGTITLAKHPSFVLKNSICLPGVTPKRSENYPVQLHINRNFLLSGILDERIAMLPLLLSAFSELPELTLHITGFINDVKIIDEFKKCKNIIYHGLLSNREYLDVFHGCSFILSTRNPECPENQCNFPSKILEALLHNRIVVSTIHYEQLDGIPYFEVSSERLRFIESIKSISSMSENDLLRYANQSDSVQKRFNTDVWNNSMSIIENNTIIK